MTRDDIIRMAQQTALKALLVPTDGYPCRVYLGEDQAHIHDALEQLAALIEKEVKREVSFDRAELWLGRINDAVLVEREACAKVCDAKALIWRVRPMPLLGYSVELEDCAAAIRARGQDAA